VDSEYDYDEAMADTNVSPRNAPRGAQITTVENNRLVPLLVALSALSLFVAGLAGGLALWALSYADKARMESRLLQVKVEGFEKALWAAKIDPNPHLPGQPE